MQQLLGVVLEASAVYEGYKLRFKILKFLLRNLFAVGVDLKWDRGKGGNNDVALGWCH